MTIMKTVAAAAVMAFSLSTFASSWRDEGVKMTIVRADSAELLQAKVMATVSAINAGNYSANGTRCDRAEVYRVEALNGGWSVNGETFTADRPGAVVKFRCWRETDKF